MAKISLTGFKDPVRRPRYIIWTGVAVLVLAAVMIVALGVTSTRWFCAEGCHKVQDDTIIAYERSTHSQISCMACHMPANANPIVFILHKAEALGELYMTVTDNFELPLNAESEVSLTMASTQCTQCHNMENRVFTPSKGIKIEHEPHAEVNAACPVCHNRVAHVEDFDLTLSNPEKQGGEPNQKHADFMSMTACFRCHGLEQGAAAPGDCVACHTPGFNLKPPSHSEPGFYPEGHAEMATEALAEVAAAEAEAHGGEGTEGEATEGEATEGGATEGEGEEGSGTEGGEAPAESDETSFLTADKAYASGGGGEAESVSKEDVPQVIAAQRKYDSPDAASIGEELPKVETIFVCGTCHTEKFCIDCHGMEMPHPTEFKEPEDVKDPAGHPVISKQKPEKCVMCHGENEKDALLRQLPPRHRDRLRIQADATVDQPAPEGRRRVRRQVLHGELPLAEVLRRLSHGQERGSRIAQAAQLAPSEDADRHGLRQEAGRAIRHPRGRGAEVDGVVRGLPR